MALIRLTQEDINRSKPPDAGWHLGMIVSVDEKPSSKKDSINWIFDLEVKSTDGNNGRHAYAQANSKAPGITMIPMVAAICNIPRDKVEAAEIDTDKLIGRKLYFEVIDSVYEGRIVKKVNDFTSVEIPPAF